MKLLKKFMSRRGTIAKILDKELVALHRRYENLDYAFESNGESTVIKKIKNSSLPVNTIFDVGANHGEWAIMANKNFPDAKIYSFEVLPATFKILTESCGSIKNVNCMNLGLSDSKGTFTANVSSESDGLTTLVSGFMEDFHKGTTSHIEVETTTGGLFCDENNISQIDLLKIDVEGFENKVLSGLEVMIKQGKVKVIQFEYGFVNIKTHYLLYDFYEFFKKNNMRVGKIYPNYVDFKDYQYRDENFYGPNYLAVHESLTDLIKLLGSK